MKLRYKVLLSTGLIWLIFLATTIRLLFPFFSLPYLISFSLFGLLAYTLMYSLLHLILIKRIEQLKLDATQHRFSNQPELTHKDEISVIVSHFNSLIQSILQRDDKLKNEANESEKPNVSDDENETDTHKDQLAQLAHYDELTALPNRVFFNEMLNKTLSHAARHEKKLALLFIDIDRFKHINDALGMKIGNQVLKEVANRFATTLRSGDIIARLGGDEFIILLNDVGHPKKASSVADKLLQACSRSIKVKDREFFLSASIGICIFPEDGKTLETLQQNADLALYKAKQAGGGVFQYFSKEMTLEASKHIKLESALRTALSNNEFVLHFQPKLNIATGTISGVEALIRWINPEIGLINPNEFIPQAEENGLIEPIGNWVLHEACRTNKSWQDQGYHPINMAVNISPKQFNDPNIVKVVEKALADSGLDPKYLELEITEMTIMEDVEAVAKKLHAIKAMGVKICIDDFGTGYTSISYLKKFPIDILKVDQHFIKGIPDNQNDLAIASAIIALGHNLGMQIVAEGVETPEQLQYLLDHHCDFVQGYYFSRPLPEQKMVLQLGAIEINTP